MLISKSGKKFMVYFLIMVIILSGFVYGPTADADDGTSPNVSVSVLGATLRLGKEGTDNTNGTQSMKIGIQISNASQAKDCGITLTLNGESGESRATIATSEALAEEGSKYKELSTVYSKDKDGDTIIYAVTITNIPKEAFEEPISIKGKAVTFDTDNNIKESDQAERSVNGIVTELQNKYPKLHITMENGTLYQSKYGEKSKQKLNASEIKDYSSDLDSYSWQELDLNTDHYNTKPEYDESTKTLTVLDGTNYIGFKIKDAEKIMPGSKIKVEITGKYYNSNGVRSWLGANGNGNDGKLPGSTSAVFKPDESNNITISYEGTINTVISELIKEDNYKNGIFVLIKGSNGGENLSKAVIESAKIYVGSPQIARPTPPAAKAPEGDGWKQIDLSKVTSKDPVDSVTYNNDTQSLIFTDTNYADIPLVAVGESSAKTYSKDDKFEVYITGISYGANGSFRIWTGGANNDSNVSETQTVDCSDPNGFTFGPIQLNALSVPKKDTFSGLGIKGPFGKLIDDLEITSIYYRVHTSTLRPAPPAVSKPDGDNWIELDLSKVSADPSGSAVYNSTTQSLILTDTNYADVPLVAVGESSAKTYSKDDKIEIYVTGISYGTNGSFRIWSGGANGGNRISNPETVDCSDPSGFIFQKLLTVTTTENETTTFNGLGIKGPSAGIIDDLEITSIYYRIEKAPRPTPPTAVAPSGDNWNQLDLSKVTSMNPAGSAVYNSNTNSLICTGVDWVDIPLITIGSSDLVKISKDKKVEIYITGISYGSTTAFRTWSGGASSNSRVSEPENVSCTGESGFTFQKILTVVNPENNTTEFSCLAIKGKSYGVIIDDLEITSIYYRIVE